MKVLLVCDRPSWAYDSIAQSLVKHNVDERIKLDVFHLKGREGKLRRRHRRYDAVFALGWQLLGQLSDGRIARELTFLDSGRTLTGIHSHHAFDGRATTPESSPPPPRALVDFLARQQGVNAVSWRLADLFRGSGLTDVAYTPNGVDEQLFTPRLEIGTEQMLRVGFSGSQKHDWRKGVTELIRPAAGIPGVSLHLAMPADGNYVSLERMPDFYNTLDVYVCASTSEGFSLSVLEAAASGRPVISTRVGGCEDLIEDGVNGFLVDRNVEAIRAKLALLRDDRELTRRMGAANRRIIEERWTWRHCAPAWLEFIRNRSALRGDATLNVRPAR